MLPESDPGESDPDQDDEPQQILTFGLIGPGTVGSVLLDQIGGEIGRLKRDCNLDLRVRAIATSQRMERIVSLQ